MARKQKELIKAATIATALDKQTGKVLGFCVKSNSSDQYYQIQMMDISGERVFFCDCEAHLWGCNECCHVKAVKEVLVAQAELMQAQGEGAIAEAEKIVNETSAITTTPVIAAPTFTNQPTTSITTRGSLNTNRASWEVGPSGSYIPM